MPCMTIEPEYIDVSSIFVSKFKYTHDNFNKLECHGAKDDDSACLGIAFVVDKHTNQGTKYENGVEDVTNSAQVSHFFSSSPILLNK